MNSQTQPIRLYLLGQTAFEDIRRLQRRLVFDVEEADGGGALVLCEHPPCITVGRSGSRAHIVPDDEELRSLGLSVHWVNRGGGCLLHAPAQLAAYVILPLQSVERVRTVQDLVTGLHDAILNVLDDFDLRGTVRPDLPGVFLDHARVAAVGVAVTRWISYYGLWLNVGNYLGMSDVLHEPGPNGRPLVQTSMEARRQRPAPMAKVREALFEHLERVFGLECHHLFTNHPLLSRESRVHVHAPWG